MVSTLLSAETVGALFKGTSNLAGDRCLMIIKDTNETKMASIEEDNIIWYLTFNLTFESDKPGLEF